MFVTFLDYTVIIHWCKVFCYAFPFCPSSEFFMFMGLFFFFFSPFLRVGVIVVHNFVIQ